MASLGDTKIELQLVLDRAEYSLLYLSYVVFKGWQGVRNRNEIATFATEHEEIGIAVAYPGPGVSFPEDAAKGLDQLGRFYLGTFLQPGKPIFGIRTMMHVLVTSSGSTNTGCWEAALLKQPGRQCRRLPSGTPACSFRHRWLMRRGKGAWRRLRGRFMLWMVPHVHAEDW